MTTSIGRPAYPDLAPYVIVEDDTVPNILDRQPRPEAVQGSELRRVDRIYPSADSLFTAGAFHKEIDNPIYPFSSRQHQRDLWRRGPTPLGRCRPGAERRRGDPSPASSSTRRPSSPSCPALLSGFGVSANYAPCLGPCEGAVGPRRRHPARLPVERHRQRAALLRKVRGSPPASPSTIARPISTRWAAMRAPDEFTDGNGQLDPHVSYQIMPQVTVFGDACNLTDAPWRRYIGSTPVPGGARALRSAVPRRRAAALLRVEAMVRRGDDGVVCAGLTGMPAVAADRVPAGLTVDRAVLLMRHGVRPPTKAPAMPAGVTRRRLARMADRTGLANAAWCGGGRAVSGTGTERGSAGLGLLPHTGCPAAGAVRVIADSDQRTIATARMPGSRRLAPAAASRTSTGRRTRRDPIFSPMEGKRVASTRRGPMRAVGVGGGPRWYRRRSRRVSPAAAKRLDAVLCGTGKAGVRRPAGARRD